MYMLYLRYKPTKYHKIWENDKVSANAGIYLGTLTKQIDKEKHTALRSNIRRMKTKDKVDEGTVEAAINK